MASIPHFLEPRPAMTADSAMRAAFDRLFDSVAGTGELIDYRLEVPRWEFACHIADTRPVLLHGSGNPDIKKFETRKADDVQPFGDQNAVYAASDGLWPMYFAILDRQAHQMSLINSCVRFPNAGRAGDPYYFFSVSRAARMREPFSAGMLYFLPRDSFVQQATATLDGRAAEIAQWASPTSVTPLARLAVRPEDFPLLSRIRGHGDDAFDRARANPDGFPWLEE